MSAQEQMDKAIEKNDMVSVKAAREMLNAATKKLDAVKNHKNEQANIRTDIGTKRKQQFEKLFKTVKTKKINKSHFIKDREYLLSM